MLRANAACLQQRASLPRPALPARCTRRPQLTVRAAAGSGGLGGLFGGGKSDKEEAARKALQDALAGKKDVFKEAEERARKRSGGGGGGGGGSGGGGGGDGGGGFGAPDFGDMSRKLLKWLKGVGQTLAAVLAFLGVIAVLSMFQPAVQLLARVVRAVLRLDGAPVRPPAQADLSKKEGLGNVEEAVMSKWGEGAEEGGDGSEGEGEGSDEE
eukprot:scaffold5.g705.t1